MARKLKPQLVQAVEYKKEQVVVELFLDRNTHEFFARLNDDTELRFPSLAELQAAVDAADKTPDRIEWIPVLEIQVEVPCPDEDTDEDKLVESRLSLGVNIHVERSWMAYKPKMKQWIEARWDPGTTYDRETYSSRQILPAEDTDERRYRQAKEFYWSKDEGEFQIPCTHTRRGHLGSVQIIYIRYEDSLWAAFTDIRERLHTLVSRIWELASTEDGRLRLREGGAAKLLTQ